MVGGGFQFAQRGDEKQRGEQAVAVRRMIRADEMPRLFAAQIHASRGHVAHDIAIAHIGAHQFQPLCGEGFFQKII